MKLLVEFDREADGRWIADIVALPGVSLYGDTQPEALDKVQAMALRRIADMLDRGELKLEGAISFEVAFQA